MCWGGGWLTTIAPGNTAAVSKLLRLFTCFRKEKRTHSNALVPRVSCRNPLATRVPDSRRSGSNPPKPSRNHWGGYVAEFRHYSDLGNISLWTSWLSTRPPHRRTASYIHVGSDLVHSDVRCGFRHLEREVCFKESGYKCLRCKPMYSSSRAARLNLP